MKVSFADLGLKLAFFKYNIADIDYGCNLNDKSTKTHQGQ